MFCNLIQFIIEKLLTFGAPEDDAYVTQWKSDYIKRIESSKETYGDLLPSLFEFVHERIDRIETVANNLRKKMAEVAA